MARHGDELDICRQPDPDRLDGESHRRGASKYAWRADRLHRLPESRCASDDRDHVMGNSLDRPTREINAVYHFLGVGCARSPRTTTRQISIETPIVNSR